MRCILLVALMIIASPAMACALTLASTEKVTVAAWGVFTATQASAIRVEIAQVSTLGGVRPEAFWIADKAETFWVAEKHDRADEAADMIQWADGRVCPALDQVVATHSRLRSAKPTPPFDRHADPTLSDSELKALSACWTDRPPI
jgi:hypothetical protein